MTAYTGGQMDLTGWRYPVVVDLTIARTLRASSRRLWIAASEVLRVSATWSLPDAADFFS
jgi:hypothetical protein